MRHILCFLSFLTLVALLFPAVVAQQTIEIVIENESFNSSKYPAHHLLISGGEHDETMFVPNKSKTIHKKVIIASDGHLKVVFGTQSDYLYVLGSFGFYKGASRQSIAKMYIRLEQAESFDMGNDTCPLKLNNPIFFDADGTELSSTD